MQTFETIAPYTIEEAYEVADAIRRGDMEALKDELGDLQLQVVYHARMAEEARRLHLDDVMASICAKMIRRHPHIFGDAAESPGWEALKAAEREDHPDESALAGVALALPALKRAEKIQRRAARVGFDWPDVEGPRRRSTRSWPRSSRRKATPSARRRSATCCSPSSIMPATSASTPRPRCAKRPRGSNRASARWKNWPTSR